MNTTLSTTRSATPPEGYMKIGVQLIFDVKHDVRLVADKNLTPFESIQSGVVSIRSFRNVMFLAKLNTIEFWVTDVGNAHLDPITTEKV
jgi:hypothetical protein